jgi:hypothetical protein
MLQYPLCFSRLRVDAPTGPMTSVTPAPERSLTLLLPVPIVA